MTFSFKSPLFVFSILGVVAVLVGAIVLLQYMSQPQDTRSKAAVPGGTAEVAISPTTMTIAPGQSNTATVTLNTKNIRISATSVRLTYTYTGSSSPLAISDITINPIFALWNCNVKTASVDTASKTGKVDFSCIITEGYSNNSATNLFTFKIAVPENTPGQTVTLAFAQSTTTAYDKTTGDDIAAIPQSNLAVTVSGNAATPTPTPTATPTAAPTTTPTATPSTSPTATPSTSPTVKPSTSPTVKPSTTPTATPKPSSSATTTKLSCNANCATDTECSSDLKCIAGKCRNASCSTISSCNCNTSTGTSTSTSGSSTSGTSTSGSSTASPSTLPQSGGFTETATLAILGLLFLLGGIQLITSQAIKSHD